MPLHAGALHVSVWQEAATLKVQLESSSWAANSTADGSPQATASGSTAAEQIPSNNVQIALWVPCLQISIWDDERRRLMGTAPDLAAASNSAAQEVFCLAVDDIALHAGQQCSSSGNGVLANWSALLEARSLQLDSHLPSSSHPVICRSDGGTGGGTASLREGPLPLTLELEVS